MVVDGGVSALDTFAVCSSRLIGNAERVFSVSPLQALAHEALHTHPLRLLGGGKLDKDGAAKVLAAQVAAHADAAHIAHLGEKLCRRKKARM